MARLAHPGLYDAQAPDLGIGVREHALLARFYDEGAAIVDRLAQLGAIRAMLLDVPPSIDISEMTDKGSINQRAVLKNRAAVVEELYGAVRSPRTIVVKGDVHAG